MEVSNTVVALKAKEPEGHHIMQVHWIAPFVFGLYSHPMSIHPVPFLILLKHNKQFIPG